MTRISLYYHGGSKNHGCEAIVRSTVKMLSAIPMELYSFCAPEDIEFKLDRIIDVKQLGPVNYHGKNKYHRILRFVTGEVKARLKEILNKNNPPVNWTERFAELFKSEGDVFISIGGDNYCYGAQSNKPLMEINKKLNAMGKKTVLWGCSIEPDTIFSDAELREDLSRYSLITARESLTYNALIRAGITRNTHLVPDPAFTLDKDITSPLPGEFKENNTVGINLNVLRGLERGKNISYKNIRNLCIYILKQTDMNIAFIPHVLWPTSSDMDILQKLYDEFKNSGRVCLIPTDLNAAALKGIISKCRFMVAARTHASIAAYSSQVPTLVLGYSVKARGIARDIFGSEDDYVLSAQNLQKEDEATNAFIKIMQNEAKIKEHYKTFMPQYIEKVWQAKNLLEKLF